MGAKKKKFEEKVVLRKHEAKEVGVFIDGTSLDRAAKRIGRRVDMAALVKGVTAGMETAIVRYYTLIPFEDDSRQRSFLDTMSRQGMSVMVKRLPPVHITRLVTVDVEIACDIVAFGVGSGKLFKSQESGVYSLGDFRIPKDLSEDETDRIAPQKRAIVAVCPSREVSYALALVGEHGIETTTAEFGDFKSGNVMRSAAKWIDLSTSETIWMEG